MSDARRDPSSPAPPPEGAAPELPEDTAPEPFEAEAPEAEAPEAAAPEANTPESAPPDRLGAAALLAAFALLALPTVALALTLDAALLRGAWQEPTPRQAASRALVERLGLSHVALTPSGVPPREGAAPHPAIDRRHAPPQPYGTAPTLEAR